MRRLQISSIQTTLKWPTKPCCVLAGAYKIIDSIPENLTSEELENDLIFTGLIGMIDPERPEAAEAVRVAKEAGIRPIMITGDHQDTAEAIAKRLESLMPMIQKDMF